VGRREVQPRRSHTTNPDVEWSAALLLSHGASAEATQVTKSTDRTTGWVVVVDI